MNNSSSTSIRTFLIPEENMKSKKNQKNEVDKMNDPDFIFNPNTKRFIKSNSSTAKRILDSYTTDQLKSLATQHYNNPSKPSKKSKSSNEDDDNEISTDNRIKRGGNKLSNNQIYKINCIDLNNDIVNKVDQFTFDFDNDSNEIKHQDAVNRDIKINMTRDGLNTSESSQSSRSGREYKIIGVNEDNRVNGVNGDNRVNGVNGVNRVNSVIKKRIEVVNSQKSLDNKNLYTIDIGNKILEQRKLKAKQKEFEIKNLKQRLNSSNPSSSNLSSSLSSNLSSSNMKDLCNEKRIINIYTDGAVSNNGYSNSSGGIGVYFGPGHENNLSQKFKELPITNQRAEVWAIIKALEILINSNQNIDPHIKLIIYTDSTYAMNVITKTWKAKDNLDIITKAWKLLAQFNNLEIKYIRAHSNKKDIHSIGNDMADRLAVNGKDL